MIGGAGKKIGTMVDLAEKLYEQVTAVREQLNATTETVDETADRVERLESEVAEQRALLEAIAEEQGIDVDGPGESSETAETTSAE